MYFCNELKLKIMKTEILEFIGLVADKKCKPSMSCSIHTNSSSVMLWISYSNGRVFIDSLYYAGDLFDEEKLSMQLSDWKKRLNRIKDDK